MKTRYILFFLTMFLWTVGFGQKLNLSQIIEKAGKQKLLCEQITKSYLMIGSAIKTDEAKLEFDDSKFTFSKNLLFLGENSKSEESKLAIQNVVALWNDFKIILVSKPTRENSLVVINQSNLVLNACNEMVAQIFSENKIKNIRLLNLCNKQRLNSQKIAKFCVAKNWKINYLDLEKDLNETLTSYEFSLAQMISANDNSPEITKILTQQKNDWTDYKSNFMYGNKTVISEAIIENTNTILNEFNKLSLLYIKNAITGNAITGL